LFSRRLLESSAKADIVVSEPQNPTAAKREYLPSRFHCYDIITNAPITLTGSVLKSKGDSVTLYLRNAPSIVLPQEKQIPNPSLFLHTNRR